MKDSFIPHNNKNKHIRLIQDDDPTSVLGHFCYDICQRINDGICYVFKRSSSLFIDSGVKLWHV